MVVLLLLPLAAEVSVAFTANSIPASPGLELRAVASMRSPRAAKAFVNLLN